MPAAPSRGPGGGGGWPSARALGRGALRLRRAESRSDGDRGRASRIRPREVGALQSAAVVQLRGGAPEDRNGEDPEVRLARTRAGHRPAIAVTRDAPVAAVRYGIRGRVLCPCSHL